MKVGIVAHLLYGDKFIQIYYILAFFSLRKGIRFGL